MKKVTLAGIALTLLVLGLTIIMSLSGKAPAAPSAPPDEPVSPAPPPPAIEELIPQGARADKDVSVRVLLSDEVVTMSMEKYLIGVLAAEMPASFEPEALRAGAVAARTDTLYNMTVAPSSKHPEADICGDYTCCMAYTHDERLREKWGEDYVINIGKIINAVISTDGVYASYEGKPILAVFHSSSAGFTEDSGNVWLHSLPYLQSVESPETAEQVPNFVSSVTVSASDFKKTVLEEYPEAVFPDDASQWVTDMTHTESGRLDTLCIGGVSLAGTRLRTLFGLRSTAVSIEYINGDFVMTTTGYGHGVGMSQYGANAMALAGRMYDEILTAYYTGVTLVGQIDNVAL